MNRIARGFLLAAGAFAAASCGDKAQGGKLLRVAVVPKGTAHEFWKAVELGARRADQELPDLEIVWKGPAGEGDAAAQIALVESFAADAFDGLCLAPLDGLALEAPVRAAAARGMPVVVFDSALASADAPIVSYVATDNRRGGELAAEEMVRLLGGRGKVLILRYLVGSESTRAREDGFFGALMQHPSIQVVSRDRYGGPDEARAVEVSESILATMGSELDGVFCSNESNVSGFLTALQRDPRKLAGKIRVVGFDSSARIVTALEDGTLAATVLQDPVGMGYRAVQAMHAKLTGKPVEPRIDTGQLLATKENLSSAEVRTRLDPLGSAR